MEIPTEEVARDFYYIYYGFNDDASLFQKLVFMVAYDLRLWSTLQYESLDFTSKGKKESGAKAHILASIVRNKLRENHRNRVFKNPPHGITIKISESNRKGRRKKGFQWSLVQGWDSDQHKEFVDKQKQKQCPIASNGEQVSHKKHMSSLIC